MTNPFPTIHPILLLDFLYGATFLLVGFSIASKNLRDSSLRIARSLRLLAAFCFLQGLQEWVDIYPLIEGEHLQHPELYGVKAVALVLSSVSFVFLLQFGLSLIHTDRRRRMQFAGVIYAAVFATWLAYSAVHSFGMTMLALHQADLLSRNTVGLFGGLAAAFGLVRYSSEIRNAYYAVSRSLREAGVLFVVFALFESSLFDDFVHRINVPGELLRTGTMALTAYLIMKALTVFDVEKKRKVEDRARQRVQSEKLASLGQLAAGIAHEINNPLTNASLGIQLLKQQAGSGSAQALSEQITAVERHIDRAAAIAQELLSYSRRQESVFEPVDINTVLTEALGQMTHKLDSIGLEQKLGDVPAVLGDRGRLRQVFINVLSNAVEAMPRGGRISIITALRENRVEASIADSGCGIAETDLPKVFEPFFTTKEVGEGTGLGLYLCYNIVKQHHGTIHISSAAGRGTTVTMTLPAARERAPGAC